MKLFMTKGLPGSGKTTFAKRMVESSSSYKRVNKDDLRAMMDKSWSKKNEEFVLKVRDFIVEEALKDGYHIIVDDTGFASKHEVKLRELAKKYNAEFIIKDFTDVPIEQCIKNDLNRPVSVGEAVIRRMYNQYLRPSIQTYKPPKDRLSAAIFDIDGTLALMKENGRSPYDYSRVSEDLPNEPVIEQVRMQIEQGRSIIVLSGRSSVCREDTEAWLTKHGIDYDALYMRAEDDDRKDYVVKKEFFDEHIRDNYIVKAVFDDRLQVCRLWYELGLPLFKIGDPDANF